MVWLSRGLYEALQRLIGQASSGGGVIASSPPSGVAGTRHNLMAAKRRRQPPNSESCTSHGHECDVRGEPCAVRPRVSPSKSRTRCLTARGSPNSQLGLRERYCDSAPKFLPGSSRRKWAKHSNGCFDVTACQKRENLTSECWHSVAAAPWSRFRSQNDAILAPASRHRSQTNAASLIRSRSYQRRSIRLAQSKSEWSQNGVLSARRSTPAC